MWDFYWLGRSRRWQEWVIRKNMIIFGIFSSSISFPRRDAMFGNWHGSESHCIRNGAAKATRMRICDVHPPNKGGCYWLAGCACARLASKFAITPRTAMTKLCRTAREMTEFFNNMPACGQNIKLSRQPRRKIGHSRTLIRPPIGILIGNAAGRARGDL